MSEHFRIEKMLERITQNYYFSVIHQKVIKYIQQCDKYNKTKSKRHKLYEKLQSLKISQKNWESVTMNFIIKLSKFKNSTTEKEYDSIMIIVNRLIKQAYFIFYQENMRAEETAYLFEQHIITNHEILTEIITD